LPGNLIYELINNDRIVGGINNESAIEAKKIYESFVKGKIFTTDLKTAEIVKLVENTYRDINLAFANELSLICEDYDINVWEVIRMANMHPRVNVLNPGPGVGGHCIPIDPWFILENIDRKNTLIEKSREINNSMPFVVLTKIENLIKNKAEPKITLFGASYKENVGDTRESPTEVIYHELVKQKIDVNIFDPLAENFKYELYDLEESVKNSDLLVLLASHDVFKKVDFGLVSELMRTKAILDTRNFFDCSEMKKLGFECYK
jgi:UDP-N-acetyl-D-mannosaminuronic acid dehydrogenase